MKLSQYSAVWCLLIVCLTLLLLTLIIRPQLCEVRIIQGDREIAAIMACGSGTS
ncbi:Hok/Gef-like protein [Shimwellia blattae DSM 4481 = NBRC 105725]|uniref:Hok/Gef-like protein n=1 Tax=Shimwellia blattae (strain ATCC 29907 / DSM 4481 / JCM 1650 / NBRC 105725 / CDC 9005-74) TaxID=630626 RepID=I2B5H7_SHIBC|nr:Hok/Gef-like protein [Shimwellia blattae DSM 4481 = NBRC 105725]